MDIELDKMKYESLSLLKNERAAKAVLGDAVHAVRRARVERQLAALLVYLGDTTRSGCPCCPLGVGIGFLNTIQEHRGAARNRIEVSLGELGIFGIVTLRIEHKLAMRASQYSTYLRLDGLERAGITVVPHMLGWKQNAFDIGVIVPGLVGPLHRQGIVCLLLLAHLAGVRVVHRVKPFRCWNGWQWSVGIGEQVLHVGLLRPRQASRICWTYSERFFEHEILDRDLGPWLGLRNLGWSR